MSYKYIITTKHESNLEVKEEDLDPEQRDFLEECVKQDSTIGLLDEYEETGSESINRFLEKNMKFDYNIKKVKI